MTAPRSISQSDSQAAPAVVPLLSALWRRGWPLLGAVAGGTLLLESLHDTLTPWLALSAAGGALWLLGRSRGPTALASLRSSEDWLSRCEATLASFDRLDPVETQLQQQRHQQLQHLRARQERRHLDLALVGRADWNPTQQPWLMQSLRSSLPLRLHCSHPLPAAVAHWQWPAFFRQCDVVLYRLDLPLKAVDLRWLQALPQDQCVWLLVDRPAEDAGNWQPELVGQLPSHLRERWLAWTPGATEPTGELARLETALAAIGEADLDRTQRRCLRDLHAEWQVQLESLRRQRWQVLLERTQWAVAAGVVMAPLPSLDLLVLAAANGLMLQEMAQLWECPWSLAQLQAAAAQLGRAALSLGVVEWSTQALAAVVKLHGATWLLGGALQALSAAYLTRVVGRAMADAMALAAGVPEAELEALLQRQAPLLVARAADEEKLNWSGFVDQARRWLLQQAPEDPSGVIQKFITT